MKQEENGLVYLSGGMFRGEQPWIHSERVIDSYEILFMVQGVAYMAEEDTDYTLQPGDVLLLEPGKRHKGTRVSENGCCFYWCHFLPAEDALVQFKYLNLRDTAQQDSVTFFFSQLLHVANLTVYPPATSRALCFLLIQYLNVAVKTAFDKGDKLVNEVVEYVRLHRDEPVSAAAIAAFFGYNSDYLSSLFKKRTGVGLKEYINKEQVNYAKSLLVSTQYSIKEIAALLHFPSARHFTVFFKYHEGISPARYKNRHIGVHYNNH